MQLLYRLGSLCHLTAVWSQQKSTIFAFQQFSPTVSLWCVWQCDHCGVYQFTPWKKWLKLAIWFVGGLTTRSLQVRGWRSLLLWGEHDGQLRVEEEVGPDGEVWKEEGGGCRISLISDLLGCDLTKAPRLGQSQSTPPHPKKEWQRGKERGTIRERVWEREGERCSRCQTYLITSFLFFSDSSSNCSIREPRHFLYLYEKY